MGLTYSNIDKKDMITINNEKLREEIQKMIKKFGKRYGLNDERVAFFNEELPNFAKKVCIVDLTPEKLEKMTCEFVEEYKSIRRLGGFNSTYGSLFHWFIDFSCAILGFDHYDFFYSKMREVWR